MNLKAKDKLYNTIIVQFLNYIVFSISVLRVLINFVFDINTQQYSVLGLGVISNNAESETDFPIAYFNKSVANIPYDKGDCRGVTRTMGNLKHNEYPGFS